jgi:hypothetical protein
MYYSPFKSKELNFRSLTIVWRSEAIFKGVGLSSSKDEVIVLENHIP